MMFSLRAPNAQTIHSAMQIASRKRSTVQPAIDLYNSISLRADRKHLSAFTKCDVLLNAKHL